MVNDEKIDKENLPEPTFDKQIEGYSKEGQDENDPVFSHAYHKFMVNLLTNRDTSIKDELINEVKKQNANFSDKLLSDVNEVIEKQWIRVLDEKLTTQSKQLNRTMFGIAEDLRQIKEWKSEEQKKMIEVEAKLERKRLAIEGLKLDILGIRELIQPESIKEIREFTKDFKDIKPLFLKWEGIFEWWSHNRWWKIIGISIALIGLFFGLIWFSHKIRWVSQGSNNNQSYSIKDINSRMKAGELSITTRAFHLPILTDYTKTQKDSVNDDFHNQNILSIQKSIDERNKEYEKKYGKKILSQ